MAGSNPAPGGPGFRPDGRAAAKDAVGTAYAVSSRVWYTMANGVITEVYYPTIDTPQIRDIQYLVTDGETFFHDERRHMQTHFDCVETGSTGLQGHQLRSRWPLQHREADHRRSTPQLPAGAYPFQRSSGVAGQAAPLCVVRSPSGDRRNAQQRRGGRSAGGVAF